MGINKHKDSEAWRISREETSSQEVMIRHCPVKLSPDTCLAKQ